MKTAALFVVLGFSACLAGTLPEGDQVYKSNCTRCHISMRAYPEKMYRTIVRHMRIKAGLTKPEADAVLAFLAANYGGSEARSADARH